MTRTLAKPADNKPRSGVDKLAALQAALTADDVAAGPPKGEDWAGHVQNLSMVIAKLGSDCADPKMRRTCPGFVEIDPASAMIFR